MGTSTNKLPRERKVATLDDVQLAFLKRYTPADDMITSPSEIAEINRQLALSSYTDPEKLRAVRNSVMVLFDKGGITIEGAMSVTAVIDHYMFNLNPESV